MKTESTLYFDGQFWVGVIERHEADRVRAVRVMFGAQPSDAEFYEFLLGKNGLWTAIPWDAPYPTPRFLLLDALREMDALRLLSPSAWERELDNQSRSRAPLSSGGKPAIQ